MLTVVFRRTSLTLPVRVPAGGLGAEDQPPAGLPVGGGVLAAEQGGEEGPGLPGVLTPGTAAVEIPLGPQQRPPGKCGFHGLEELVICRIVTAS